MPTLSDLDGTYLFESEVQTPQLIDSDVDFTDAEGDFDGGTLVVSGLLAEDIVGIRSVGNGAGQISVVGGAVFYEGVQIGTFTGGTGADLIVTFDADATTAAVEAVIESLTYQNLSTTPTYDRFLGIRVTDAAGNATTLQGVFQPTTELFTGVNVGESSRPELGDLDGDGDLDLVVGAGDGTLHYFENVGDAANPVFVEQTGAGNPFDAVRGDGTHPELADLDGDGDLDLLVGYYDGTLHYFENQGDATSPAFVEEIGAANPFNGLDVGYGAKPQLADLDGDGDLDAVIVATNGAVRYYENTGTAQAYSFTLVTGAADPFSGFSFWGGPILQFADIDGDGDIDIAFGQAEGPLGFLENVGTALAPDFQFTDNDPFQIMRFDFSVTATFGDLDGDGFLDVVIGNTAGDLFRWEAGPYDGGFVIEVEDEAPADAVDDTLNGREGRDLRGGLFRDNGAGVDVGATTVTAVNGDPALVGVRFQLASGAWLTVKADGSYLYEPGSVWDDLAGLNSGGSNTSATDSFTYSIDGGDTATATVVINGRDSNDTVEGTAVDDVLKGGIGDDVVNGGDGADTLRGEIGDDTLFGQDGDDVLVGGEGDDILQGGAGDDILDGGAGLDAMYGGAGNDTYELETYGDRIYENADEGIDTFNYRGLTSAALPDNVENLNILRVGDIDATGNVLNNVIVARGGNNMLVGWHGDDTLWGGAGDDSLQGGDGADLLHGEAGKDVLTGGAGDDALHGGAGDDYLMGDGGDDQLFGGHGDDVYVVADASDVAIELAGEGRDTVWALGDYTLTDNVEDLLIYAGGDLDGVGNALNNRLTGNADDNRLEGLAGAHQLFGVDGEDVLVGGAGEDQLTGGEGADLFLFTQADTRLSGLGQAYERDRILDFNVEDGDRIDLSAVDARVGTAEDDAFVFAARFSGVAGQAVLVSNVTAGTTLLRLDVDGDGKADFEIQINGHVTAADPIWIL
jgi:VCBS repeat-containing protein